MALSEEVARPGGANPKRRAGGGPAFLAGLRPVGALHLDAVFPLDHRPHTVFRLLRRDRRRLRGERHIDISAIAREGNAPFRDNGFLRGNVPVRVLPIDIRGADGGAREAALLAYPARRGGVVSRVVRHDRVYGRLRAVHIPERADNDALRGRDLPCGKASRGRWEKAGASRLPHKQIQLPNPPYTLGGAALRGKAKARRRRAIRRDLGRLHPYDGAHPRAIAARRGVP